MVSFYTHSNMASKLLGKKTFVSFDCTFDSTRLEKWDVFMQLRNRVFMARKGSKFFCKGSLQYKITPKKKNLSFIRIVIDSCQLKLCFYFDI